MYVNRPANENLNMRRCTEEQLVIVRARRGFLFGQPRPVANLKFRKGL
jgi:hypothetical protein